MLFLFTRDILHAPNHRANRVLGREGRNPLRSGVFGFGDDGSARSRHGLGRRLDGGLGIALTGELQRNCFCRDVVDRAGDALDIKFALLEQGQQLLVVHADLLGEFVYADAHSVGAVLA